MSATIDRAGANDEVPDTATVDSLVAALASNDEVERRKARQCLVSIGRPAIAPLAEAQGARDMHVRWEAVKTLAEIKDPMAAPALVQALEDHVSSVRWLAAEGLIALERDGLDVLLQALIERGDSFWLRQGAHHVLRVLVRERGLEEMRPVLEGLEGVDPQSGAAVAALAAQRLG